MIIDSACHPTKVVDLAWWHDGEPFTGERLIKMMDGPYTVNGKPRRVDKAFIQPAEGNTLYTWTDGTRTGRDAIRAYMDYTVELTARGFFGLLAPFFHRMLAKQTHDDVQKLKLLLEARVTSASATPIPSERARTAAPSA